MKKNRNYKVIVIVIFLIALALRSAAVFSMRYKDGKIKLESWEQETIALNILDQKGFVYNDLGTTYRSYCEPLYVYFIVIIFMIFGKSHLMLGLFQILISALSCVLLYYCAKRVFDKKTGVISMLLMVVHPGLILYVTKIHPLNIDILFAIAVLLVFLRFFRVNSIIIRDVVFGGVLAGVVLLTRPTFFIFIAFCVAALAVKKKISFKNLSILLIVIGLVGSTWAIRNFVIHKELVFTRTGTGKVFWIGNNPLASGSAMLVNGKTVIGSSPESFKKEILGKDEITQNKLFRNAALVFIKSHPGEFFSLFFKKLYYFFWFSPQTGMAYSKTELILYKLFYTLILIFALYGLFLAFIKGMIAKFELALPIIFIISIAVVQSLFYVEGRHRWVVEPFILMFGAHGILAVYQKVRKIIC